MLERTIAKVVEELCSSESLSPVIHPSQAEMPLPSVDDLAEMLDLFQAVLFPGYFKSLEVTQTTLKYYTGSLLDRAAKIAKEQIKRGFCFVCPACGPKICAECEEKAARVTQELLETLPRIRRLLALDVEAAYHGDPASKIPGEVVFCYPSIRALSKYRIAHELYLRNVPIIPRIICEMAHSETGIDIHPGAKIGERFFMDHGTGIVIGETAIVGNNVRIYQGVTLGAKSFPLDSEGRPIKGIPRHPIVEDDVIIYAGATILGRITIGKGSVIGGNVWLTKSVPPGSRVLQTPAEEILHQHGSGI